MQVYSAAPARASEELLKGPKRADIQISPTTQSVTPAVVASGQVGPFVLGDDTRASFSGSADGNEGWTVDNILLVEVQDPKGSRLDAFIVGFVTGEVHQGAELLDNVGDWSPKFGPRSPDLSLRLPHGVSIVLKVTALDNGHVGSASALYLVLEKSEIPVDDLRDAFWRHGSGM